MSFATTPNARAAEEIFYPCSDGQPMAETTIHVQAIILLLQALQDFFRSASDVFLAADLFWYWEEGNPNARRAPDVMVVKGVANQPRRSFFSWRENNAIPCVVFEIASQGTWSEDLNEKRHLYAELGVREYFLFDPEALYLCPALLGFRRNEQGVYVALKLDAEERLRSEELGLYLRVEGAMLRLTDAATGQPILTREEQVESERRRAESERRRAELERGRAELERGRAESERGRAESEGRRAETERRRAENLEDEVTRLRELLKSSQKDEDDDVTG